MFLIIAWQNITVFCLVNTQRNFLLKTIRRLGFLAKKKKNNPKNLLIKSYGKSKNKRFLNK
jgi:hypothetical protein